MATTKKSQAGGRKSSASKPASRAGTAKTGSAKAKTARTASANGTKRAKSTASRSRTAQSRNGSRRTTSARPTSTTSSRNGAQTQDRMVGRLKQTGTAVLHVADRAGRPTITVAAAVAGIAGGLALRGRSQAAQDGMAARSMAMFHDVDPKAVLGGLGKATVQLSQRSKSVAKDIERVAEQAERVGKILS